MRKKFKLIVTIMMIIFTLENGLLINAEEQVSASTSNEQELINQKEIEKELMLEKQQLLEQESQNGNQGSNDEINKKE